jgi:hypothetical protein
VAAATAVVADGSAGNHSPGARIRVLVSSRAAVLDCPAARIDLFTGGSMAGRGSQTFNKRQKEQSRREKQQEKQAKRLVRKQNKIDGVEEPELAPAEPIIPLTEEEMQAILPR